MLWGSRDAYFHDLEATTVIGIRSNLEDNSLIINVPELWEGTPGKIDGSLDV